MLHDQNGKRITQKVCREADGTWGATVWSGGLLSECVTSVRRYHYATRREARDADISDDIGKSGRISGPA